MISSSYCRLVIFLHLVQRLLYTSIIIIFFASDGEKEILKEGTWREKKPSLWKREHWAGSLFWDYLRDFDVFW